MQITSDGLKLKNEGRVFHTCETQEELEKALDLLGRLVLDVKNSYKIPPFDFDKYLED